MTDHVMPEGDKPAPGTAFNVEFQMGANPGGFVIVILGKAMDGVHNPAAIDAMIAGILHRAGLIPDPAGHVQAAPPGLSGNSLRSR